MSESNHNWVCFNCRFAKRLPKTINHIQHCPSCDQDLYCLGYKVEVPKKSNKRAWKDLELKSREIDANRLKHQIESDRQQIVHVTQEIKNLESKEYNKDRQKLILQMKSTLQELKNK